MMKVVMNHLKTFVDKDEANVPRRSRISNSKTFQALHISYIFISSSFLWIWFHSARCIGMHFSLGFVPSNSFCFPILMNSNASYIVASNLINTLILFNKMISYSIAWAMDMYVVGRWSILDTQMMSPPSYGFFRFVSTLFYCFMVFFGLLGPIIVAQALYSCTPETLIHYVNFWCLPNPYPSLN